MEINWYKLKCSLQVMIDIVQFARKNFGKSRKMHIC